LATNISWHASCYLFNVQWDTVFSVNATSSSLVIRWAYQYYILAVEVKNPGKLALLSFNRTAAFLYNVTVSENDILEAR